MHHIFVSFLNNCKQHHLFHVLTVYFKQQKAQKVIHLLLIIIFLLQFIQSLNTLICQIILDNIIISNLIFQKLFMDQFQFLFNQIQQIQMILILIYLLLNQVYNLFSVNLLFKNITLHLIILIFVNTIKYIMLILSQYILHYYDQLL